MSAQSWINEIWYGGAPPPPWLIPLSSLFGAVARSRRELYRRGVRRPVRMPLPVIVIGNLSVGGTGKTPLACWLIERLRELGYTPGVVTRGHGGSSRRPRLVRESDDAALVGDEPLLLARRTRAAVAVGRDRPAAAELLLDACDVIVSDDGLQHYALDRDCEIVVVDAERGFGNGRLLPAGPLREATSRIETVDAVVMNGGAMATAVASPTFVMRLHARQAVPLVGTAPRSLSEFAGVAVHAVAGIGNPQRFFGMLRALGMQVSARELEDHAVLTAADLDFGDDRPVLMTEKDAVKCVTFGRPNHFYVPVNTCFEGDGAAQLLGIVTRAIAARSAAAHPSGTSAQGHHG